MQINTGLRSFLAAPAVYRTAMRMLGGGAFLRWFIDNVLSLRDGQKIIDFGCGPADVLSELPATVDYVGLDFSESYIDAARQRYGDRGVFLSGDVHQWALDGRLQDADIVMCYGVLHHMDDDEAKKAVHFARQILKPGGRFIFFEPCYLLWQSRFSVFMMSKDRGQNVRTEQQWRSLVADVFPNSTFNVVTNVNRLGYTNIIAQCTKD